MDYDDGIGEEARTDKYGAAAANFLFGNIDEKGRLEEADYLDSEAKEQLFNVQSDLAVNNQELQVVATTMIAKKKGLEEEEEEDENYDEFEVKHDANAVDYADEREAVDEEEDEFGKDEQGRLAAIALRNAAGSGKRATGGDDDDDENYDEDDEETEAPAQPKKPVVMQPNLQFVRPRSPLSPQHHAVEYGKHSTVPFTRIFVLPPERVPQEPQRKRFGIDPVRDGLEIHDTLGQSDDDLEEIDADPESPEVDPVELFLQSDANHSQDEDRDDAETHFSAANGHEREPKADGDDDDSSAMPLRKETDSSIALDAFRSSKEKDGVSDQAKDLRLVFNAWEDSIGWGDEEEEEENGMDAGEQEGGDGDDEMEVDKDDDENNDDDGGWEDVDWEDSGGVDGDAKKKEAAAEREEEEAGDMDEPEEAEGKHGGEKSGGEKGQIGNTDGQERGDEDESGEQEGQELPKPKKGPEGIVTELFAVNDLLDGEKWTDAIRWASESDEDRAVNSTTQKLSRLLLNMNDPNLNLELTSPTSVTYPGQLGEGAAQGKDAEREADPDALQPSADANRDPFNISNDQFYFYGGSVRGRRVDRQSVLRGLNHAPPCTKARTSDCVPSDEYLIHFHRPQMSSPRIGQSEKLIPLRRKRPKGGMLQIAGQVPKRRSDLSCASKDAYRVFVYEYALERLPVMLPISGMASRIVTYSRRKPKNAMGEGAAVGISGAGGLNTGVGVGIGVGAATGPSPPSDVVYLAKDEPPPLYAGDLPYNGTPVSVVESTLYAAPCMAYSTASTDFLVVKKDNHLYVRDIDEVVSVGVTEPRLEVMAPNTDRFKRYAHDRVLLWILREFERKKRKGIEPVGLKRTELATAFTRRRTYPQTSLPKILKEVSIFEGGTYIMSEPVKGFDALESEKLRTINPEETCAFEAMEAGWEALIRMGIRIFTHPTSQGNILGVSQKTGLAMGRRVAEFIRLQLLHTPWYRSSQLIDAQKSLRTQMSSALTRARAAHDLSEGGSSAESRLAQMTSEDCFNLLTAFYRVPQKKIPSDLDGRRKLLRSLPGKRGKGSAPERIDFAAIMQEVLTKHRAGFTKAGAVGGVAGAGSAAGGGGGAGDKSEKSGVVTGGASTETTGPKVISLESQLKAFQGNLEDIPLEDERTNRAFFTVANATVAAPKAVSSVKKEGKPVAAPATTSGSAVKTSTPVKKTSAPVLSKKSTPREEVVDGKEAATPKPTTTKKIKKLKVTKKKKNEFGEEITEVRYVTEPAEIERLKGQQALKSKKAKALKSADADVKGGDGRDKGGENATGERRENPLKISIGLHKISKATKAGKSVMKGTAEAADTGGVQKLSAEGKSKIMKIKIDRKKIEKSNEEAAAKRRRVQYGEDADYTPRKQARKRSEKSSSRRPRNGLVILNEILAKVEKEVRNAQGYIAETYPELVIQRVPPGETNATAKNLAKPRDTGLDFTVPVKNVPAYGQVVKEQMYLNLIRIRCTQAPYFYRSAQMFIDDMKLLADNARKFHSSPETQWVVQHAELLLQVAEDKIRDLQDEITKAEEMIAKMERDGGDAEGAAAGAADGGSGGGGGPASETGTPFPDGGLDEADGGGGDKSDAVANGGDGASGEEAALPDEMTLA